LCNSTNKVILFTFFFGISFLYNINTTTAQQPLTWGWAPVCGTHPHVMDCCIGVVNLTFFIFFIIILYLHLFPSFFSLFPPRLHVLPFSFFFIYSGDLRESVWTSGVIKREPRGKKNTIMKNNIKLRIDNRMYCAF